MACLEMHLMLLQGADEAAWYLERGEELSQIFFDVVMNLCCQLYSSWTSTNLFTKEQKSDFKPDDSRHVPETFVCCTDGMAHLCSGEQA